MIAILSMSLVSSCTTVTPSNTESITETAAGILLELAVNDPAQRVDLSNYLYSGAVFVRSIAGGTILTPDEFDAHCAKWFPQTEEYKGVVLALSWVYSNYFPQINGDAKTSLEYLESFAEGIEKAADKIAQ
jgi:hypothetical protein